MRKDAVQRFKMKLLPAFLLTSLLVGCATVEPVPNKRPLTTESIQAIGKVKVAAAENNRGVEKSWFMTDSSAAGAQYGLIGALVTSVMDAIINAGPSKRAQQAANEIAALLPADALNVSLMFHLQGQVPAATVASTGISVGNVALTQKVLAPKPVDDVLEIVTSYTLSEDASAFRFVANVTYQSSTLKYATPYTFKGKAPKAQLTGPVYSNVFTYQSAQLPIPVMTPDLRARLEASIRDTYKTDAGAPPAPDSQDGKALAKELEAALDDKFTKDEVAIFLTRVWLSDGGAMLKREIENAHAFIAKYVVEDLNSTAIPSVTGKDELLITETSGRTVRRVGTGVDAGAYVSAPGDLISFTTYGNATSVAKVHLEKIQQLSAQARAKNAKKKKA
jgi:hypothetical protein